MLLKPKLFKYKRSYKIYKYKTYRLKNLAFGEIGTRILSSHLISSLILSKLFIKVKKIIKKQKKLISKFWFNTFPYYPLSKKPKGLRMGKGSGKFFLWYTWWLAGTILLEFKNIRLGRIIKYLSFFKNFLIIYTIISHNFYRTKSLLKRPFFYLIKTLI